MELLVLDTTPKLMIISSSAFCILERLQNASARFTPPVRIVGNRLRSTSSVKFFLLAWEMGVNCRGVYFWWVPRLLSVCKILSFDISKDEFRSIALPDVLQRKFGFLSLWLMLWNESVSILFFPDHKSMDSFEIWVMDDYFSGINSPSWTKHLTVGPPSGDLHAVGILEH